MGLIFALILIQKAFIMYTDFLWFSSLGQAAVFKTMLGARALLGLVAGAAFFVFLYFNLRLARRPLPGDLTLIGKRLLPEEERQQIEQYADRGLLIFAITGAVMGGIVASGRWRELLQFIHGGAFGDTDALFGLDVGFYVFRLGLLNYVVQSVFYAVVIALVGAVLVHVYQESIRLVGNTVHAIPRARTHVLGLLGLALLVKAVSYRLAQFNLLYSSHGQEFAGPSYADVHGRLPVLTALIVLSALAGIVMFATSRSRSFNVPIGALAAVVLVSLLGGWMYPALLQSLVVKPNQLTLEQPFISHNITATLKAYGLDTVKSQRHGVREDLTAQHLRDNRETVENIRLWDHRPLETTFQQQQALRSYYRFSDVDVDRYTVNGRERQVMLSARELDYSGIQRNTWVSQHLLYTHGYGVCMAPVNEIVGDGLPNYWIKDFPPTSSVGFRVTRPQLYYYTSLHPRLIEYISSHERTFAPEEPAAAPPAEPGPGGPEAPPAGGPQAPQPAAGRGGRAAPVDVSYVIVNTKEKEFDYPRGEAAVAGGAADESGNVTTHYTGQGDVQLSNFFRRFAFFMRFRHVSLLLTPSITAESRILFNRSLPERLMALAPIMGYDPDPYVVIDKAGQLKWINDAYTATNLYPYSARTLWFGANYLRNSVKVVTDAYEGLPKFYVMPPSPGQKPDPVVACWREVFPSLFTDFDQMDPVLQEHIRYPQLLFRVQAEIYAKYHMKDPQTFFQKEDMWAIPPEVYAKGTREVEAYYVNMSLPSEREGKQEFLLMLPFALAGREDKNMVAWMAGRCDAPNYGELIVYDFPKSLQVAGPMQVESLISQDAEISQLITLWGQQQSRIIRGNLLVIPINSALLYVEPFYLEAPNSPLPQLKLVVLMYHNRIVNASTLSEALSKLFGAEAAAVAGPSQPAQPTQPGPTEPKRTGAARVRQLLQQALSLDQQAQQALARGDLAGYQAKQREQQALIQQALQTLP
jgi:hypothetical protein